MAPLAVCAVMLVLLLGGCADGDGRDGNATAQSQETAGAPAEGQNAGEQPADQQGGKGGDTAGGQASAGNLADKQEGAASLAGEQGAAGSSAGEQDGKASSANKQGTTGSSAGGQDGTASSAGEQDGKASSANKQGTTGSSAGGQDGTASSAGEQGATGSSAGEQDGTAGSADKQGAAGSSGPAEKTVVDNAGHQVVVPARPQRIVAPYLEDPLVVLGIRPVAQVLYGNVEQNYLKDQLAGADIIDTTDSGLPLEKLLDLSPDLIIIGQGMAGEGAYEQYAKIAPTYVVDNVNHGWRETLLDIADLLGKRQVAEEKLAAYDREIGQAKEQLGKIAGDKTAAVVVLSDKEFYTMGHIQGAEMLFDELGVQPHPLTPAKEEWSTLSLEKLNELDADYIFVIKTERYQTTELERNSLWKGLPAVREGRVFEVESGIWQYSGLICNERTLADIMKAIVEPGDAT